LASTAWDAGTIVWECISYIMGTDAEDNYVTIPNKLQQFFDQLAAGGAKVPESLLEHQVKAYIKFLDSLGSVSAIKEFVNIMLTHPSAGNMLGLDDPKVIDALYGAQKQFELEIENHQDEIKQEETEEEKPQELDAKNSQTYFVSAKLIDEGKILHVKKNAQIKTDKYLVNFYYSVLNKHQGIYTVQLNKEASFIDNTGKKWFYRTGHKATWDNNKQKWNIVK